MRPLERSMRRRRLKQHGQHAHQSHTQHAQHTHVFQQWSAKVSSPHSFSAHLSEHKGVRRG
eukprot:1183024-Prorocentrum_minimum.AAC.1